MRLIGLPVEPAEARQAEWPPLSQENVRGIILFYIQLKLVKGLGILMLKIDLYLLCPLECGVGQGPVKRKVWR